MKTTRSRKIATPKVASRRNKTLADALGSQFDGDAPAALNGQDNELMQLIRRQIELIGEDPERDGLRRTPKRVRESLRFLTRGYSDDPKKVLNNALFEATSDEMVIVKDI